MNFTAAEDGEVHKVFIKRILEVHLYRMLLT